MVAVQLGGSGGYEPVWGVTSRRVRRVKSEKFSRLTPVSSRRGSHLVGTK